MAYSNYAYYTDVFLGEMSEEDYKPRAERASEYIDYVTFDRAAADDENVKKCCCAIADAIYLYDNGGGKSGETIDGYSVSYASGVSKTESRSEAIYNTALRYLSEYMYRGAP